MCVKCVTCFQLKLRIKACVEMERSRDVTFEALFLELLLRHGFRFWRDISTIKMSHKEYALVGFCQ